MLLCSFNYILCNKVVLKHKFMYFINRLHILHSTLLQQLKQRTNKRDIRQTFQSA